jgi:NADPH-dependent glutamate synthase beta subunit-like oxidoreductase/Pyruvate/2-oxoacid:ferredoxin oxidoreductase delta subunit
MGLLKKNKKKKKLRISGSVGTAQSALRPRMIPKLPPCQKTCPSGTDIRGWVTVIAQREKLGLTKEEAYQMAFEKLVESNPFPSMMGRVCPHPCEDACNREAKDGAVAINCVERFIGDWALENKLQLPKVEGSEAKADSIGVIGAGPAGLSFAYQLARRGYPVTVYEQNAAAGGMIYYGIPFYRQPADVLKAEVQRILDVGVELKLNCQVGKDISVEDLKAKHKVVFLGVGAHKGRLLGCSGEEGPGVWTGTDYLHRVADGETVDVGKSSAVIGGGDTAIDAARAARRAGAEVTILYRRTRVEMPAIESEIEDALKEDVKIEYLVAPIEIKRDGDKVKSIVVQKMELGEPDDSGRRRPVPLEGSEYEIQVDSVVAAISQEADWSGIETLGPEKRWLEPDENGKIREGVYAGGDAVDLAIATTAVGHGRVAALAVNAELTGIPIEKDTRPDIPKERVKIEIEDVYPSKPKAQVTHAPVEEWLAKPDNEIVNRISEEVFLEEMTRCLSCGQCFGCERCWMYCTPSCFVKAEKFMAGQPFFPIEDLEKCDGCKKCGDECPCGLIDMV